MWLVVEGERQRGAERRKTKPGKQASATSRTTVASLKRGGSIPPPQNRERCLSEAFRANSRVHRLLCLLRELQEGWSLAHNRRAYRRTPSGWSQGRGSRERSAGAAGAAAATRPAAARAHGAHAARACSARDEQVRQPIAGGSLARSSWLRAQRTGRAESRQGGIRALLALFTAAASRFASAAALHLLCACLAHNRAQTSVASAASALGAAGGGPEPGRHEPCMMIRNGITGPSIKLRRHTSKPPSAPRTTKAEREQEG